MVKKPTTKKSIAAKAKAKTSTSPKKSAVRSVGKSTRKAAATSSKKVDYYPNRMTLAISVLAGTLLVLVTIIAVLGSRS